MRFFCTNNVTHKQIYISLRTHDKNNSPKPFYFLSSDLLDISSKKINLRNNSYRRTSSGVTSRYKGSMTVEAALVLPIFMFCIINLLFGIQIFETSGRVMAALHQTGNEICSCVYSDYTGVNNTSNNKIDLSYAVSSVKHRLGGGVSQRSGIRGGLNGLDFTESEIITSEGVVKIAVSYYLKFPVDMVNKTYKLGNSYYGHAWIGYDVTDGISDWIEDDPIVYITPSGTVYHLDIKCMHLNPQIKTVDYSMIQTIRNVSGANYYSCELCGGGNGFGAVYITSYGTRYHGDIRCSGLKRTIRAIHLSEVGGRRQCMTCGY